MPLTVFDGRVVAEVHEHFDRDGNPAGTTVITREPEWDEESRMWALALAMREAGECGRCGGDLAETLDYDTWKWEPQAPVVCLRCLALATDRDKHAKHPERAGMIHLVAKKPRPPKRPQKRG